MHEINDTICAMATAPGESGIGIIRISGPRALAAADAVFAPSSKGRCSAFKSFTVRHGRVVSRKGRESEVLDEALCTVMRAPKSYTREDVVEISCHGGIVSMRRVLELVLENGCRLAEPGEFTRRAFLNGRIDLAQAEAVLDVIRAKTDAALRLGMGQLQGELSRRLERIRETLLGCLARLEAAIDFPEDDPRRRGTELAGLEDALSEAARLLEGSGRGRVYREGLQAVICGKPNAGKSSLLNALLREERSIVTPVAGTTRDTVEETIDIRGIPVRIVDTAGLLEPRDLVEKKAVARTRSRIRGADLVIAVFDGSRPLDAQDALLMRALPARRVIAVVNKCDLKPRLDTRRIRGRYGEPVELSAKKARNIRGLEEAIAARAGCAPQAGAALLGNIRHIQAVKKIKKIIEETLEYRDNELPTECAAQNLKDCCSLLDGLLGKSFSGDMLDRIFGEFCIGK